MGAFDSNLSVGEKGLLCPQRIGGPLLQCGLYPAVRATCYRIAPSDYNFFGVLEKYNPDTCTFFTPLER